MLFILLIIGDHIAIDGTYKLDFSNYPLLMVGTTGFQRHYHPYALNTRDFGLKDYTTACQ